MDSLDRIRNRAAARRVGRYLGERLGKGLCFVQHDYDIGNAAGGVVRGDINDVLDAIVTWNSGASEPATMFARQRWADTTAGVIKRRNAANSGWIVESTDDETFVLSRSSDTVLDVSDKGKVIRCTGSYTQTFSAVASLTDGWFVGFRVEAGQTLTLDPNSTETINGATTLAIAGPASGLIFCNGSALYTVGYERKTFVSSASLSGTDVEITGIASGARRITFFLNAASLNGATELAVQIGDSGGYGTTSYNGSNVQVSNGAATSGANPTGEWRTNGASAAATYSGKIVLERMSTSGLEWICTAQLFRSDGATGEFFGGAKALSAELDRAKIKSSNGTSTFDAGTYAILVEYF